MSDGEGKGGCCPGYRADVGPSGRRGAAGERRDVGCLFQAWNACLGHDRQHQVELSGSTLRGGPTINPLSELRWGGGDSVVPQVNAELFWKQLVLRSSPCWGGSTERALV